MFEKALEFRRQQGDPVSIGVARWCVGKTLRMMGHTEEALEIQQELFQEYQSAGRKSGFVYEEIAECLVLLGRARSSRLVRSSLRRAFKRPVCSERSRSLD